MNTPPRFRRAGLLAAIFMTTGLMVGVVGCADRTPVSVQDEIAGRPTPTPDPDRAERQARRPAAQPEVQWSPPTLPQGQQVNHKPDPIGPELKRVDVLALQGAGTVQVRLTPSSLAGEIARLFDGDEYNLVRTQGDNPLVVDATFAEPIRLKSARVYPSHASSYAWVLYPNPQEQPLVLSQAPGDEWSRIELPEAFETAAIRIAVYRMGGDDNVHVNEIELFTE